MNKLGKDFDCPIFSKGVPHAGCDIYATPSTVIGDDGASVGNAPLDVRSVTAQNVEVVTTEGEYIRFQDLTSRKSDAVDCVSRYFHVFESDFVDTLRGIGRWLTGQGDHHLNLQMFHKPTSGLTPFSRPPKLTLRHETSGEQVALAWGMGRLHLAWTGDDDDHLVNVLVAVTEGDQDFPEGPVPTKMFVGRSNDDAGPGLTCAQGMTVVAWHDGDDLLHIVAGWDGRSFSRTFPEFDRRRLYSEGPPKLATDGTRIFVGYVEKDSHRLAIYYTADADWRSWRQLELTETAGGHDGVALAYGRRELYAAWTGRDDDARLNVIALPDNGTSLTVGAKHTLRETSSEEADPALAFHDDRLYLAWTGSDDDNHVNFAYSVDGGATFLDKQTFEKSHDNAGPAIVAAEDGTVVVAWNGTG